MEGLLITMVLVTSILVFMVLLQPLVKKDKAVESRVNRYLRNNDSEPEPEKKQEQKFKLALDFRLTKQKIRKALQKKNKNEQLEMLLTQAGVPLKPEEYVMFRWISIALGAGILHLIMDTFLILPVGALIGAMIPKFIIKTRTKRRLKQFNDALPEMITTVVGALRAGFSFPQALKTVMEESTGPMKEEIALVLREMQYGMTVEESLNRFKERMPSEDLNLMVQAIIIQRQVGGNLATVLDKIGETIRDRIRIQGQIKTLTAQGKMSGLVVGLLPVILAFLLFLVEPTYIAVMFTHPVGIILLVVASISCMIGFFLVQKVTSIEV